VLKVETDQGAYALKRVQKRDEATWSLVEQVAEHVKRAGYLIPVPVRTQQEKRVFPGFAHRYLLLPWQDGQQVEKWDSDGWLQVSRHLALFHTATRDWEPEGEKATCFHLGKWTERWRECRRQMAIFQMAADLAGERQEMDDLWLSHSTYVDTMADNAVQYLEKAGGDHLCLETSEHGKACHGNLHRRNVLRTAEGFRLIDWRHLTVDVRARDLAQWLIYAYGRTGKPEIVVPLLKAYQSVSPLKEEEYQLVYAQFLFPHRIAHVLFQTYHRQKYTASQAVAHLNQAVKVEEKKLTLIRRFPVLMREAFGVTVPKVDWL
jgi:CotS family spore coat protein